MCFFCSCWCLKPQSNFFFFLPWRLICKCNWRSFPLFSLFFFFFFPLYTQRQVYALIHTSLISFDLTVHSLVLGSWWCINGAWKPKAVWFAYQFYNPWPPAMITLIGAPLIPGKLILFSLHVVVNLTLVVVSKYCLIAFFFPCIELKHPYVKKKKNQDLTFFL